MDPFCLTAVFLNLFLVNFYFCHKLRNAYTDFNFIAVSIWDKPQSNWGNGAFRVLAYPERIFSGKLVGYPWEFSFCKRWGSCPGHTQFLENLPRIIYHFYPDGLGNFPYCLAL